MTPGSLGDTGRSVRCVGCNGVWFEQPREVPAAAFDAEAAEPSLIRPPLNDVVDIGAAGTDPAAHGAPTAPSDGAGLPYQATSGTEPADDAPSSVPTADPYDHVHAAAYADAPKNVESAAARATKRRQAPRRPFTLSGHTLPAAIFVLALILLCLAAARHQVVRTLPQTASLYARIGMPVNLRGLAFENIKTAREMQDGVPMLVVEGDIIGTTGRHTEVPRLRFAVTDVGGKEIYAWTARPSRNLLPPGEALPFRSRLASPPTEASGISVRFFNRHDAQAGFM